MAKILLVESDAQLSTTLQRTLAGKGHQTRVTTNGAAALLAAHEDVPDVVLLELAMPILEGHEVIVALRHDGHTAHIPVIALTAGEDDPTYAGALAAGANVLLHKPVEPQELLAAVDRLASLRPKETTSP